MANLDTKAAWLRRASEGLNIVRAVLGECDDATSAQITAELRELCVGKASTGRRYGEGVVSAIRALLKERPGLQAGEIADALDGAFETASKRPRHLVTSTLTMMLRRGYVSRNDRGHYALRQDDE